MKKVTMFLWNHFTNDARVMREALTLSENDIDVKLIAIEKKNDNNVPKNEDINSNFKVNRVRMYPIVLDKYQENRRIINPGVILSVITFGPIIFKKSKKIFTLSALFLSGLGLLIKNRTCRRNAIKVARSLRMIIKGYEQNSDIYHAHDLNTLTQGVICSKLRLNQKKLIYDSHEIQTDRTGYNPKIIKIWEGILINFVDETIVENETRAEFHKELYNYRPKTLYNYSDFHDDDIIDINLHQLLNIDKQEKILLYQGGIQQGRGLEQLVKMMHYVEEGILLFIGDGKQKNELLELVKSEKLEERIKFIPKVSLQELPAYTKQAYIGFQVLQNINLNHYTASSNKLFEYIMADVPVVSCNFPEIKKIVSGEQVGLSVDASEAYNIAEAVNILIHNVDLRNKFSDNCSKVKLKYNWQNEEKKLLEIYRDI